LTQQRDNPGYVPFYRRPRLVGGACIATALAAAALTLAGKRAEARLMERLAAYRRSGEPVTTAELPGYLPQLSAEDNGAVQFWPEIEARRFYLSSKKFEQESPGVPFVDRDCRPDAGADEETWRQSKAYLRENAEWLTALHGLSSLKGCAFGCYRECRSYTEIRHPFVGVVSHGVGCLCLEALVRVRQGRLDDSIHALRAAKALNLQLLAEPFLVNVVNVVWGERAVLAAAEVVAEDEAVTAAQLDGLRQACVPFSPAWIQKALVLDRLSGLDYYHFRDRDAGATDRFSFSYLGMLPLCVSCRKVDQYLDYMDACVELFGRAEQGRLPGAAGLEMTRVSWNPARNPLLALAPPIGLLAQVHRKHMNAWRELDRSVEERCEGE